jgi:hypothetical protein
LQPSLPISPVPAGIHKHLPVYKQKACQHKKIRRFSAKPKRRRLIIAQNLNSNIQFMIYGNSTQRL